jgi:hypothetical protein
VNDSEKAAKIRAGDKSTIDAYNRAVEALAAWREAESEALLTKKRRALIACNMAFLLDRGPAVERLSAQVLPRGGRNEPA